MSILKSNKCHGTSLKWYPKLLVLCNQYEINKRSCRSWYCGWTGKATFNANNLWRSQFKFQLSRFWSRFLPMAWEEQQSLEFCLPNGRFKWSSWIQASAWPGWKDSNISSVDLCLHSCETLREKYVFWLLWRNNAPNDICCIRNNGLLFLIILG